MPATNPIKPTADDAATTSRKREPLKLPSGVTSRKLVLDFLKARATNDVDAGGQGRPFITHTGKVVIHAKWLRDYIAETIDENATVSDAVRILRDDLGYADRSVAVVGAATKNLSVWMADAPSGTGSIPRMSAPERKSKPAPAPAPEPAKPARKRASKSKSKSPFSGEAVLAAARDAALKSEGNA